MEIIIRNIIWCTRIVSSALCHSRVCSYTQGKLPAMGEIPVSYSCSSTKMHTSDPSGQPRPDRQHNSINHCSMITQAQQCASQPPWATSSSGTSCAGSCSARRQGAGLAELAEPLPPTNRAVLAELLQPYRTYEGLLLKPVELFWQAWWDWQSHHQYRIQMKAAVKLILCRNLRKKHKQAINER